MYRIAIQPDEVSLPKGRGKQSFSRRWVERLQEAGHEPVLVDVNQEGFFDRVKACDGFMWTVLQGAHLKPFGRRVLSALEHVVGIPVFPSWKTFWHFDDKIGQHYLLEAAGLPAPKTWVFWLRRDAVDFCRTATYPLVIKLASGIGSKNVQLLRDFGEATYWINRLFGDGLTVLEKPRLGGVGGARRRARDALRYLVKGVAPAPPALTEVQRGYVLVQEFLAGNAFDTRLVVVGSQSRSPLPLARKSFGRFMRR